MLKQTIYNSANSGLLKSVGPFKLIKTDRSINGVSVPKTNKIKPFFVGKIRIHE